MGDTRLLDADVYLNGTRMPDAVAADPRAGWVEVVHRTPWGGPTLKGRRALIQRVWGKVEIRIHRLALGSLTPTEVAELTVERP